MTPPITLKQLRYMVAVAEERHFGRAANTANISQPALSAQIQALEDSLGVQIFERSRRRVLPTPEGAALVARAKRILAEVDDLVTSVATRSGPLTGRFRLGVIPTLGPGYLPQIMPPLRAAYPDLKLYVREDQTDRLIALLDQGSLEAALLALPIDHAGLDATPLFDEPFRLAVPVDHPLAGRERVGERDLATETVLLLEDGHCLRDQSLPICRAAGSHVNEEFSATSLATLREMVASGLGVTLLPATGCDDHASSRIVTLPFTGIGPTRRMALIWRREAARADDLRLLATFLRHALPRGVLPIEAAQAPASGVDGPGTAPSFAAAPALRLLPGAS